MGKQACPLGSDASFNAWLDGELPAEQRADAEQWLRDHPVDAERVTQWQADRDDLRRLLEPVLDESVPTRLAQIVWNRGPVALSTRWQRIAVASAVFAVGGVLGGLLGWGARSPRAHEEGAATSTWVQRAAMAHRVYVPESRHPVEVNVLDRSAPDHVAQQAHLARWLTARVEVPVRLFDLRALGFDLVGGRLLPDAEGPSAQLMYQNAAGQRITVYLRKPAGESADIDSSPLEFERWGELALYHWTQGAAGVALVGDMPRERLAALAEAIHRQGAAPAPRS